MKHASAFLCIWLCAGTALADAPLSAIDWLSETVTAPPVDTSRVEAPVTSSVEIPSISVAALTARDARTIGLLKPIDQGLPDDLWRGSDTDMLVAMISDLPRPTTPALQKLLLELLLLEAETPMSGKNDDAFLIARLDKLLSLGALDQANDLIGVSDLASSGVFRRAFDVALLQGNEDRMCDMLRRTPDIAPTFPARIFCLARGGDWAAAALTLETGEALSLISAEDDILFARFLEPELNDGAGPLPQPATMTPLIFRVREAIGEHSPTTSLPIAFAHSDLRSTVGWKAQLEAAERLTAAGVMSPEAFAAIYRDRKPAASGGVWDRVSAFQRLEAALKTQRPSRVTRRLGPAWQAMQAARTEKAFAKLFEKQLSNLTLSSDSETIVVKLAMLASDATDVSDIDARSPKITFLRSLIRGAPVAISEDPLQMAIISAFTASGLPSDFRTLRRTDQQGQALLQAISYFERGLQGDKNQLTQALQTLRALGYERIAIAAAVEAVIQNDRPS